MSQENPTKKSGLLKKIGIGCGGAIILFIIIGIFVNKGSSSDSVANGASVAPAKEETPEDKAARMDKLRENTIAARDLHRAYKANEVAADDQYKNKTIAVIGRVEKIKKDFLDNIIVYVNTGDMFSELMAYFRDDQKSLVASLQKGQTIWFTGKVEGLQVGSVRMKQCQFVQQD